MLQLALLVATATADIPEWMAKAEANVAAAFNTKNWTVIQATYNPGAVILAPGTDTFALGTDVVNVYKSLFAGTGISVGEMHLEPKLAHADAYAKNVWHEIGVMRTDVRTVNYYVRWVQPAGQDWQIAFNCMDMGIGPASPGVKAAKTVFAKAGGNPPTWMKQAEARWVESYNNQSFHAVSNMYSHDAQIIPFAGTSFVERNEQTGFETFFSNMYKNGIRGFNRVPLVAYIESPKLVHEFGYVRNKAFDGNYYVRWVADAKGQWSLEFNIMGVPILA